MELDSLILCVWFNYGIESTFLFFTISFSLLTSHSSLASLASSLLTVAWPRRPAGHVLLQPSPSLHSNSLKSFKSPAMSLIQSLHPWRQPALDFNGCLCLHHRHLRTQSICLTISSPVSVLDGKEQQWQRKQRKKRTGKRGETMVSVLAGVGARRCAGASRSGRCPPKWPVRSGPVAAAFSLRSLS